MTRIVVTMTERIKMATTGAACRVSSNSRDLMNLGTGPRIELGVVKDFVETDALQEALAHFGVVVLVFGLPSNQRAAGGRAAHRFDLAISVVAHQ